MKKLFFLTFYLLLSLFVFSQSAMTPKFYYSFAGKPGDRTITWGEYTKARKELKPIASNIEIKSFTVAIAAADLFVDEKNTGNQFSKKTVDLIEKFRAEKKLGMKISIEDVVVIENGTEEKKVPDMVIKIY